MSSYFPLSLHVNSVMYCYVEHIMTAVVRWRKKILGGKCSYGYLKAVYLKLYDAFGIETLQDIGMITFYLICLAK